MKRLSDLIISTLLLILSGPVLVLFVVLIRVTSGGPVIFRQKRIGKQGRPFYIYKLRSMKAGRPASAITLSSDERITPIGHVIRRTKIAELPQLFNVIRGDMSLVGPRPDVPGYYDTLKDEDQIIWTLRPGLTGLDSITYFKEQSLLDQQTNPQEYYDRVLWPAKLRLNLWYARNRSFWIDFLILINTVSLVLTGKRLFRIGPLG
jgi:lipopolysaccharide/colanic/teichoic acid biosynthesis glycosyltransferase